MKKLIIMCASLAAAVAPLHATSTGYSIGFNFGADEPNGSATGTLLDTDIAGVGSAAQAHWNNTTGASGSLAEGIVADNKGVSTAVAGITVDWASPNTWSSTGRGEENNGFTGADRTLMLGYLDTGNATTTTITINNIPTELTANGYEVIVYALGGVAGRGGTYRITDAGGTALTGDKLAHGTSNPSDYLEDTGESHDAGGTHVKFTGLTAASIVVVATTVDNPLSGTPRAPVNAIQLIAAGDAVPEVRGVIASACEISVDIDDVGPAVVNQGSVTVKLDGETINAVVSKANGKTSVSFDALAVRNSFLASGSNHTLDLSFTDTRNRTYNIPKAFSIPVFSTITGAQAGSNVSTANQGFLVRMTQIEGGRGPGDANSIANGENQLAGLYLDANGQPWPNIADLSGANANGLYVVPVINWDQEGGDIDANNPDNFNTVEPAANPQPNTTIPGIPTGDPNNISAEITGFLDLKKGCYVFGVNSDDGFLATIGNSQYSPQIGSFNAGRGASDTLFRVAVEQDGLYPIRLTWWEGGGGANVEFFSITESGERILVGDTSNPNAVKVYTTGRGPGSLRSVGAQLFSTGSPQKPTVIATFVNDLTSVDTGSIKLTIDGQDAALNVSTSGNTVTARHVAPGTYPLGTSHAGVLTYSIGGQSFTRNFTIAIRSLGVADIPGGLAIDAEHFDYGNGQTIATISTMPYDGSEYADLEGIHNVDYHVDYDEVNGTAYRIETPNVPMDSQTAPAPDLDTARPGFEVSTNHKIGWAGGDWFNYTRTFTNSNYKIYAAQSHGDAAGTGARLVSRYGVVTSGVGTDTQEAFQFGTYSEPATGEWGRNALVVVKAANGNDAVVRLSGTKTIRVWLDSGDFDWFVFVPTTEPTSPPTMVADPVSGTATTREMLVLTLNDFLLERAINASTIKLSIDGTDVTSGLTVTDTAGGARVEYTAATPHAAGNHNYTLTAKDTNGGDLSFNGSFLTLGAPGTFVIEAEDFNFGGGQTKAEASTMPLQSGLYDQLSSTHNIDYHVNGQQPEGDIYRVGENPNVPMSADGDRDRGSFEVEGNHRIGWVDSGEWYNYTRTFPANKYQVYASLSRDGGSMGGYLSLVDGADSTTQTATQVGSFQGPQTGGWGVNRYLTLRDDEGEVVELELSGTKTVRFTSGFGNGDFDHLVFVPVGGDPRPSITGISKSGSTVTVTWTGGGTLEWASAVTGPWTSTGDSDGSFTGAVDGTAKFYRVAR